MKSIRLLVCLTTVLVISTAGNAQVTSIPEQAKENFSNNILMLKMCNGRMMS